jgi:hypothetical protein
MRGLRPLTKKATTGSKETTAPKTGGKSSDPEDKDPDYQEVPSLGRSRISVKNAARAKSNRQFSRTDEMGYIDPDHIDQDVYEEHKAPVDESKNKSPSAIAIFQDFIHRSASRAVQEHLAGVYACLAGPADQIPEPDNIPLVATAAAATAVERPGDAVAVARDLQSGDRRQITTK